MTRKKNVSEILLYTIIGIVVAFMSILWLIIGIFLPNPPEPEIKYGEFPFEIVYEIDGEVFTINDTYVCEYDGFGCDEGNGKYRQWKGYLKSTGKETYRCNLVSEENRVVDIFIGSAEYYMSDPDYDEHYPYLSGYDPKNYPPDTNDEDKILEKFNVRIISYKLSELHIKNGITMNTDKLIFFIKSGANFQTKFAKSICLSFFVFFIFSNIRY